MATPATTARVRAVVEPVVLGSDLVLEDLEVTSAGRRSVVRVTIDLDEDAVGSLDLDTLAEVSRRVGAALDAADPVHGEYTLEVSTPGTSRPLTEARHFTRARTRLVRLRLRTGAEVVGRLRDVAAGALELGPVEPATLRDVAGDPTFIPLADVASGQVEVELSRTGSADDLDDGEG